MKCPVLSIEGRQEKTDERWGGGVYASVKAAMEHIQNSRLIFGASVTATTANLQEITGKQFLDELRDGGCKAVIYVEFVPVAEEPCPFAPYSDINVKNISLRQALCSPLFAALRDRNILTEEHSRGCVLFERKDAVEALIAENAKESRE